MDTILEELSPVRKRGQCPPAFTMHQRRRSLDRLTSPEDRHTAVISRVLAPSGSRLLSWASDGHRPKAQLEGPQTLLIAGFGWDEKNSVCYLAISQATVRGILSMEVIPARHRGNAHLHLPRHWFADTLKFGPILSEPVCFLSSLHPAKPHGARCRDSQIQHSCTQAEGGGGGAGQSGRSEGTTERTELLAVTLLLGCGVLGGGRGGGGWLLCFPHTPSQTEIAAPPDPGAVLVRAGGVLQN